MQHRLTLTTLVTILFMATACASEPAPAPDTKETDRLSRQIQELRAENETVRNELATLTAAGAEQQQTPAPEETPVTEISTATPDELDAKPSRPTDNICSRSPAVQKNLLRKLSVPICSIVTGEDLFRIEEIDFRGDLWAGDLDNLVNLKELKVEILERSLPENVFADLVNLETLYIDLETYNDEPWSLDGMLTGNAKLRVLRIETSSETPITLIKEALEGLQELEEISIEEITSLDDDAFNGLESLKKVELTGAFTDEQIEAREFVFPANMVRDNPGIEYWSITNFAFPKVISFASLEQLCRLGQYYSPYGQSRIGSNRIGDTKEIEYQVDGEKAVIVSEDEGTCQVSVGEPNSNGFYPESQVKKVDGGPQTTP